MKEQIHSLDDVYVIHNSIGTEMHFSGELLAWNSIVLILLAIASLMVMVNRMGNNNGSNRLIKVLYGGLAIVSIAGLFYPIEFGLIGINIIGTIILLVDFFKHKKV